MSAEHSFAVCAIVSCGTLRGELRALQEEGFLGAERVLFTAPGLHEAPRELEEQLTRQLAKARELAEKIIVVWGACTSCFREQRNEAVGARPRGG